MYDLVAAAGGDSDEVERRDWRMEEKEEAGRDRK